MAKKSSKKKKKTTKKKVVEKEIVMNYGDNQVEEIEKVMKETKVKLSIPKITSKVISVCFKCGSKNIEFYESGPNKISYRCKGCGWISSKDGDEKK